MKLGLSIGYSGAHLDVPVKLVQRAEELGYDSVWTAEAYGSDAVTPLAYLAALTKRIKLGTGDWPGLVAEPLFAIAGHPIYFTNQALLMVIVVLATSLFLVLSVKPNRLVPTRGQSTCVPAGSSRMMGAYFCCCIAAGIPNTTMATSAAT